MRIGGWYIDGFGLFADYLVDDLSDGLTVVCGPNESGKTTILDFIRGVLFGFPDGRSSDLRHPPLRGGGFGGRLFIDVDDGRYVIERSSGPRPVITRPSGDPGTQDDLGRLLGPVNRSVFRNVFAFSLSELEKLSTLEESDVTEKLVAAPLIGAGRSPREVIAALGKREDQLLRPSAKTARINALKADLKAKAEQIRDARREAQGYPGAVRDMESAATELQRLDSAVSEMEREADRYQMLVDLWEEWSERMAALDRLASLPASPDAPADALDRLKTGLGDIRAARATLEVRQGELVRREAALEGTELDDRLPPIAGEVKKLFAGVSGYQADLRRTAELERTREVEQDRFVEELRSLGAGWDRERLEGLDTSIPAAENVQTWRHKIDTTAQTAATLRDGIAAVRPRRDEALREADSLQAEVEGRADVPPESVLEAREDQLRILRAGVSERAQAESRFDYASRRIADLRRIASPRIPVASSGARSARTVLIAIAGLLLVAGAVMVPFRQVPAAIVLLAAAVVAGAIGLSQGRPPSVHIEDSSAAVVKDAEEDAEARRRQLETLSGEVAEVAGALGLPDLPPEHDIERELAQTQRLKVLRSRVEETSRQLEQRRSAIEDLDSRLDSMGEELSAAEKQQASIVGEWDAWRAEHGVPEALCPEAVNDLFTSVRRCRESLSSLAAAEREVEALRASTRGFEVEAGPVLKAAGEESGLEGDVLAAALATLNQKVLDDENARGTVRNLERGIRGLKEDVEAAMAKMEEAGYARDEVLAQYGAADEAELREFVDLTTLRDQLRATVEACDRRIEGRVGRSELEQLRAELAAGDVSGWGMKRDQARAEARRLKGDHEATVRTHQDLKRVVKEIAESSDVISLETDAEGLREELRGAVEEWRKLALARALVQATLERYEREHQPKVVARASVLFSSITNGRYAQLVAPGGERMEVIDERSARVSLSGLSTGTVQQLYLSIRFAYAEEYAENTTLLPLIMDEVLVNFDPVRAKAVVGVVAELSERNQVLMFTCHPETVEMMREGSPDMRLIELQRFGGDAPILGATPEPRRLTGSAARASAASEWDEVVLAFLREVGRPCSKSDVLGGTEVPEGEWQGVVRSLVERRLVEQHGRRRGATYTVAGQE